MTRKSEFLTAAGLVVIIVFGIFMVITSATQESPMHTPETFLITFKCLSCGHVFEMTLSEARKNATEAEGPRRGPPPQVCPKCNLPKALAAIPCPKCKELLTAEDTLEGGKPLCPRCGWTPGKGR
ncbi:MAG: hypothetical protein QGD94_06005 [Planctomycetia bacterium]|nr:hypothetical protein [Planctomycetia bacterium]